MKNFLVLLSIIFSSTTIFAQTGFLRGTVYDENGEAAPFATVQVIETGTGTSTDMDGKFSISLDAGVYAIKVSYVGYTDKEIKDVAVKADDVTILDVNLSTDAETVGEILVEAKVITNTDQALNSIKSKAAVPIDGISNATLRQIGGSKASDVIKAVTGVSIQGGKYVFVRGLGDRYTKTVLNGMDIPGLDPDRNTVQMDIFPSNLIENIFVFKAFSPDLPADFAGGVVNIVTKEFPEAKNFNVSVGMGYNPAMNLNANGVAANGSSTDFLGFDNGMRSLPIAKDAAIPDPANTMINPATGQAFNAELENITRSFNSNLNTTRATTPINYNLAVSAGNQFKPNQDKSLTLGYNAALNYRNTTTHYDDVQFNAFVKNDDVNVFELDANRVQKGALTSNNVLLSGLLGGAVKWGNEKLSNKISANILRIQNGESQVGDLTSETFIDNSVFLVRDNIEYTERTITNALLKGVHSINGGGLEVEWKVSPTISTIEDKDIRVTPLRYDDEQYSIQPSEGAIPQRFWRNLQEENLTTRLDVTKKITLGDDETNVSKIKAGVGSTYKHRDYEILSYRVGIDGQSNLTNPFVTDGDAEKILSDQNIWNTTTAEGTYIKGNYEPTNTYDATQNILAAYAMGDLVFSKSFRAIVGARVEKFDHTYSGQNNLGTVIFNDRKIIDVVDFLPSVNVVYSLNAKKNETMNLRGGFARTLARPSFKEASIAEIFDAVSGRTFIGNINLQTTHINNFDFRWEYFQQGGQSLSVSAFYKKFDNPIELVAFDATAPNDFQPRNVGQATVLGVELEVKKNLSTISEALRPYSIGTNLTLVDAKVEMDEATYASRLSAARTGEDISTTRPMQGLSPYILNAFLNYNNRKQALEGSLSYNVQGPSLVIVGINTNPDVYQLPFHSLNIKLSKNFGNTVEANGDVTPGPHKFSLRVQNLLGAENQKVYQSYNAADQLFEFFKPARTFSVSYGYSF